MKPDSQKDIQKNLLSGSRNLTLSTMVSRILGLLREILSAAIIGAEAHMSSWVLAITLPNLFRKIFGEGALGTAMVPVVVHSMETEGPLRARERFSTIFIWLCLLLAGITVAVSAAAFLLFFFITSEQWKIAMLLTPLVMPYSIFICAVGVLTCYANSLREYFLPSLTAILQNLIMLAGFGFIFYGWMPPGEYRELYTLAIAVIVSGILELLLMLWIIRRKNMSLILNKKTMFDFNAIKDIMTLALPGILAASAGQISLIADRAIAACISSGAVANLYFSERLVYLPIGVFAFAFGTVSLSEMSRIAVRQEYGKMIGTMIFSLRNLLFVTIPITVFMFLYAEDLLQVFYTRGKFDAAALKETLYAFQFYIPGIPFFAAYKVTVAGFTARKDMKTPMFVTLTTVTLNIILNLLLMRVLAQGGIALATVITSILGNLLFVLLLVRKFGTADFEFPALTWMLTRVLLAAAAAGFLAVYLTKLLPMPGGLFFHSMGNIISGGIIFGLLFMLFSLLLRIRELQPFLSRFSRFKIKH